MLGARATNLTVSPGAINAGGDMAGSKSATSVRPSSRQPPGDAADSADKNDDWVWVYVRNFDDAPLREERYVMILPDGTVKAGLSDARGEVHEERVPLGPVDVVIPDAIDGDMTQARRPSLGPPPVAAPGTTPPLPMPQPLPAKKKPAPPVVVPSPPPSPSPR